MTMPMDFEKHQRGKSMGNCSLSDLSSCPLGHHVPSLPLKALVSAAGIIETARYAKKQLLCSQRNPQNTQKSRGQSGQTVNAGCMKPAQNTRRRVARTPRQTMRQRKSDADGTVDEVNQDGLPETPHPNAKIQKIGMVSMFDGVGSVYHIIKRKNLGDLLPSTSQQKSTQCCDDWSALSLA